MYVWLIIFVLGGSIGFILASVIAAERIAGLMRENKSLREELARHQYESRDFAEQSQLSTLKPSATFVTPSQRFNTGADTWKWLSSSCWIGLGSRNSQGLLHPYSILCFRQMTGSMVGIHYLSAQPDLHSLARSVHLAKHRKSLESFSTRIYSEYLANQCRETLKPGNLTPKRWGLSWAKRARRGPTRLCRIILDW